MEAQRLSDIPIGESVTGCIWGPSGSGKTWTLCTAGSRSLYCNVEDRLATLRNYNATTKGEKFNPFIVTVSEESIPEGGAKALDELVNRGNEILVKHLDEIDFVLVDGATALRRFAMNKALELNQKLNKSKTLSTLKALTTEVEITDVAIQDYAAEIRMINNFILQMKEFCSENKKHFFMTAHERIEFNKPANIGDIATIKTRKPGFTGRTFPDEVPGLFDLVWHLQTKGAGDRVLYQARTAGDSEVLAKTCYPGFKVLEDNPNLQDIIKRIKNGK